MINIQKGETGSPDVTITGTGAEIVCELAALLKVIDHDENLQRAWSLASIFHNNAVRKEADA